EKTENQEHWLEEVNVKVAGMSAPWKMWNLIFVCVPKCVLVLYTAKAGINFLMETAGVDDIIVNSVALNFLLGLDELIAGALMSDTANEILKMCEDLPLHYDDKKHDDDTTIQKYSTEQQVSKSFWLLLRNLFSNKLIKLIFVIVLTTVLVVNYYHRSCDYKDGRWVSKAMYAPINMHYTLLNAFIPFFFPPEEGKTPYWQMPE
ncbi:unnamed protein product, partial [Polarella glacialis]